MTYKEVQHANIIVICVLLSTVNTHSPPLTDGARLLHCAESSVMALLLTHETVITFSSITTRVREELTHTVQYTPRQPHSVLCAQRICPLPRYHSSVASVPRPSPILIVEWLSPPLCLELLDELGDARLLQHVLGHARKLRLAIEIVIYAIHHTTVTC